MARTVIFPNGAAEVVVPASQYIQVVARDGAAKVYYMYGPFGQEKKPSFTAELENETATYGPFSEATTVRIEGGAGLVYYDYGAAPSAEVTLRYQGAPAAKTVSATLTAAEILTGIITVNQAAGAASALQLPLASAMDTALPVSVAGDSFDFSLINTSTVDAEDATITTNTGWTLVGDIAVHARSAVGSLNTSGRFRARKTGTAAWTLYRLS